MTTKIIIRERWDDYMAFVDGHPELWERGKTVSKAIRALALTHNIGYDIEVKYEVDYERLKMYVEEIEQKKKEKLEKGIR